MDIVDNILRRAADMENDRGTLDSHLEEVAARVLPSYVNQFTGKGENYAKGRKNTEQMFDSTGACPRV